MAEAPTEKPSTRHTWSRDPFPHAAAQSAFRALVPYCRLGESNFEVSADDTMTRVVYDARAGEADEIERLLQIAYERVLREKPAADPAPAPSGDRSRRAARRESTWTLGPGLQVFEPPAAALMAAIDQMIVRVAREIGATEYATPHLVPAELLDRVKYASSFPQHLLLCHSVAYDLDELDAFARGGRSDRGQLRNAGFALAPAACMILYPMLEGRSLDGALRCTLVGHCARFEGPRPHAPERLTAFRMREIVVVGTRAQAEAFRAQSLEFLTGLVDALKLPARLVAATDPFFGRAGASLATLQRNMGVKHELEATDADGNTLAVSSANLHGERFGSMFGIRDEEGNVAHSACLAFGLERWLHWLTSHCGEEPAGWPELLRTGLSWPVPQTEATG